VPNSSRSARSLRLSRGAAAGVVLVVIAGLIYLVVSKRMPLIPPPPTSCTALSGKNELPLSVGQAGIAATIAGVATKRDMPVRAVTIAYAAALQESKLTDLDYGDRDSVGVFQQRPSEGWGTPQQIENPVYATGRFLAALAEVPGYLRMPVYQAAQAVQRSADGYAYDQYAEVGAQLASAFYGSLPHAMSCYYADPLGKPHLTAASQALDGTFGDLQSATVGDPAVAIDVRRPDEGWAVAAWLISHASSYGISDVRYQGYEWLGRHGSGLWKRERTSARTPVAPGAVVFG
jgi:hypothetical protein